MSASCFGASGSRGFSLVEVLVAVAILSILAAVLSPLVVKHIESGRSSRTKSDAQVLADAIAAFQADTGHWPVSSDANIGGTEELSRLVGLPSAQIADTAIPDGAGTATGDGNWDGGGDGGNAAALEDLLMFNRTDAVATLYPLPTAADASGWRGPYLDRVPLDPWGDPYVCNVRYLRGAQVSGVTTAEENNHAVFCLSAGHNRSFETSFDDATALGNTPGGDDVGALVQANLTRSGSGGGGGGGGGSACGFIGIEPPLGILIARAWSRRRRAARAARA